MLSHVTVGVKDVEQARRFYGPILKALGLKPRFADAHWAGWQPSLGDRPLFIVTRPFDGEEATVGNGQMIALMADKRATVDQCYALALQLGGTDAGQPDVRPHYHPNYYGAYFRDPDGNKLCVCCHLPE
ncbi:VOC family protein [Flavisphingomonas formosensis]|uniref:VOC family protein n=1 Tax=Flavisphingomonas formosensis TaxID=861534 RepID=UPI0012FA0B48|nr:VOC family protein [Sphingomonas formosensis]